MKNKMIYALGALMVIGFGSCDLTEKPTSYYEKDTYFVTEDKARMAVVGIYDCLETGEYYGQYIMPFFGSDDMFMVRGVGADGTRRDLSHYMYTSSNTWIASVWKFAYQGLDRANLAIASIEQMEGYEGNTALQELVGQAKFLRAFLAFDLVRFFGDVPFSVDYTSGYEQTSKPRMDRELIYDQIIDDLNFAKEHLYVGSAVASSEIPCKGAARALLMRVYLQRAGYSLSSTTGKLTRPDDTTHKSYFEAVIREWETFKAEGYHNFYGGGYEQLFKNYSQLILNNQESLWEIAFEPNQGQTDNAGMWATYNGPIVDAPGSYSGTSSYMGRANAFFTVLPYWKSFYESNADGSQKDVRRDVNFVDYAYVWNATTETQDKSYTASSIAKSLYRYPGKWRREWMALGFVDPNNTGVNYCPLRYADVVLMAAEAYNETNNTTEAWKLLNDVRQRAEATPITSANYASLMKAPKVYNLDFIDDSDDAGKFRTALYWERGFELCYEGQRKYDFLRWGCLGDALRAAQAYIESWYPDANEYINASTLQSWDPVSWASSNYVAGHNFVDGKHELYPIPLAEIQSNAALNGQNNPGFE